MTPEIIVYEIGQPRAHQQHWSKRSKRSNDGDFSDLSLGSRPVELYETVSGYLHGREISSHVGYEQVSWLRLLCQMHFQQQRYMAGLPVHNDLKVNTEAGWSNIGVLYRERTWDLMPPEITRPLATSPLGNIIAIAHRLGMRWLDTRLSEGFMRAEGNGHSLISTLVRGLGPVFQYGFDQKPASKAGNRPNGGEPATDRDPAIFPLVPSIYVDMMACGIIVYASWHEMSQKCYPTTGVDEEETRELLQAALLDMGLAGKAVRRLTDVNALRSFRTNPWSSLPAAPLCDLIGIVSPFIPMEGSTLTRIVFPIRTIQVFSPLLFWESREVLCARLEEIVLKGKSSPQMQNILDQLRELRDEYGDDFFCRWDKALSAYQSPESPVKARKLKYLSRLRDIHAGAVNFIDHLYQGDSFYRALVAAHATVAIDASTKAWAEPNPRDKHGGYDGPRLKWHEIAHLYVDYLDRIITETQNTAEKIGITCLTKSQVEDAWWTLVLRGISWYMSVWITVPNYSVPSYYYDSQTRVYIS